jgi:hypothetical protein
MTDVELIELLRGDSPLNKARQQFSWGCARIEQSMAQRKSLNPIQMRIMEFDIVKKIAKELGVEL